MNLKEKEAKREVTLILTPMMRGFAFLMIWVAIWAAA